MNFKNKFKFADPDTCHHAESIENKDDKCKRCNSKLVAGLAIPKKSPIKNEHLYRMSPWYFKDYSKSNTCDHKPCIQDRCSHCCDCRKELKEDIAEWFLEESYLRKMEVIGYPPEYYKEKVPSTDFYWKSLYGISPTSNLAQMQNEINKVYMHTMMFGHSNITVSNPVHHVVINNFDMGEDNE